MRLLIFVPLTVGLLLFAGSGCVSLDIHEKLATQHATLQESVVALEQEKDQLVDQLATSQQRGSDMRDTYEALVAELHDEIELGSVEIRQLRDGIRLNVQQHVIFDSGSTRIGRRGRSVIAKVAARLGGSTARIDVEGHSDNFVLNPSLRARYGTNWELAGARAARVVRMLQEEGVAGHRLNAVSKGPFSPIVSNDSEAGRRQNRRIEIRLYPEPSLTSVTPVPAKRAD